jgi:hypothetical protein
MASKRFDEVATREAFEREVLRFAAMIGTTTTKSPISETIDILTALKKYQDADPIGLTDAGYIVFGKDNVPWGMLARTGRSSPTHGWTKLWEIYSLSIIKSKGDKFVTRSRTAAGAINAVRRLKPNTLEDMFKSKNRAETTIKGFDLGVFSYIPDTTSDLRRVIFNYLKATKGGEVPEMSKELQDWYEGVEKSEKRVASELALKKLTVDTFRTKSIVIEKLPYACDRPIMVREMSLPYAADPQFSEPKFYSSVEELTQYPHIVGLYNLKRLVYPELEFFEVMSKSVYTKGFSMSEKVFHLSGGGGDIMSTHMLIFPGEFMEEKAADKPKPPAPPSLEFDDIFSLDI